jgi:hypothetical protein
MRAAVALLLLLLPPARLAVAAPGDRRAEAAKLVDRGAAEFDRRQYQEALGSFRRALELYPSPKIHLNLGYVFEKLGDWRSAAEETDRFLAENTGDAPASIVAEARKLLARVSSRIGRLRVPGLAPGDALTIDGFGQPIAPGDGQIYVAPGSHEIVARAGQREVRRTMSIGAGETLVLDLGEDRPPPPAVAPPPVEAPPPVAAPHPEVAPARPAPTPLATNATPSAAAAPSERGLSPAGRRFVIGGAVVAGALWLGVAGTGAGAMVEHQRFVDAQSESARRTGFALAVTNDVLLGAAALATVVTVGYALWSRFHH